MYVFPKKRSRLFTLVLYEDTPYLDSFINQLVTSRYDYAYIFHSGESFQSGQSDAYDDVSEHASGKNHYHFLFGWSSSAPARYISSIASEFQLREAEYHLLRNAVNVKNNLMYLTHEYECGKIRYSIDDVICSSRYYDILKEAFTESRCDDEDLMKELTEYVIRTKCNFAQLTKYAINRHLLSYLRKYQYILVNFCNVVQQDERRLAEKKIQKHLAFDIDS